MPSIGMRMLSVAAVRMLFWMPVIAAMNLKRQSSLGIINRAVMLLSTQRQTVYNGVGLIGPRNTRMRLAGPIIRDNNSSLFIVVNCTVFFNFPFLLSM